MKLCLCATVYFLWMERNNLCFGKEKLGSEVIKQMIKEVVRERAFNLSNVWNSRENVEFVKVDVREPTDLI